MPRADWNLVSSSLISYPSNSDERKKIGQIIQLVNSRIHTQKKIIEQLETLIKVFREKIFSGTFRFKDEEGNNFNSWVPSTLENICHKESSNISANKIEDNFGNYIIYGASGVLRKIDFYEEENDYISIVKDGAGVGRLFFCEGKSSVLGTMEIIKPKLDVNVQFLFYQLSNIDFTKYVTGSTIPHIYFKDYKNEKVKIPSKKEQTKIANFLSSIDEKIETEKKILSQYELQKKYLLANLFA
ncbi:MAG: restriction endonuclease subunit S [Flavobacteriia bacterium]|nr:restriction endonuclease subunit S [Flavobacteriia bacterium]